MMKFLVNARPDIVADKFFFADIFIRVASMRGFLGVVKQVMRDSVPSHRNIDTAFASAVACNHTEIVDYFVNEAPVKANAKSWNYAFDTVAGTGNLDAMDFIKRRHRIDHVTAEEAFVSAAYGGHIDAMHWLNFHGYKPGQNAVDLALEMAATKNQVLAVRDLMHHPAHALRPTPEIIDSIFETLSLESLDGFMALAEFVSPPQAILNAIVAKLAKHLDLDYYRNHLVALMDRERDKMPEALVYALKTARDSDAKNRLRSLALRHGLY
jgi:hypothetical protein